MYSIHPKIGVLFCAVLLIACGGSSNGSPSDPGTSVPDSGADLMTSDAGCIEGPQPDDPCMSCTCTEGEWNCIPSELGAVCALSDCCYGSATCVQCDQDDSEDCPGSGLQCLGGLVKTCVGSDQCSFEVPMCVDGSCECITEAKEDNLECDLDPNDCTLGDRCEAGQCIVGEPRERSDGNPCTVGTCLKGEIEQNSFNGTCSDNNPCTVGDNCQEGFCVSGEEVVCVANPCSVSAVCDPEIGSCVQEAAADGTTCVDLNPCVLTAACNEGVCESVDVVQCLSSGPCFDGVCDVSSGACLEQAKAEGASCEHPNFCVETAACQSGSCIMNTQNQCDDGNPCTVGVCNQTNGGSCVQTPVPSGSSCISDDACAQTSVCNDGLCQIFSEIDCDDGNPCTVDNCDSISGLCVHPNVSDGIECAIDDECVLAATCFSGDCAATETVICNDGNSCTVGSCDPSNGFCTHSPLDEGTECATGDACFLSGVCANQTCEPTNPVVCDDNEPCTDDNCHSIFGCQFTNNTLACDDESVCTAIDLCVEGVCEGQSEVDCDDGEPCTLDLCDPDDGCSNVTNPEGCQYYQLDHDDTLIFDVAGLSNCGPWVYDRDCPEGHVAVGYYGTVNGQIESITLDCRKLLGDGSLGANASGVTFGVDVGGQVFSPAPCAQERVLNGIEMNVGTWWNRLVGHCHPVLAIANNQPGYESTIIPVEGIVSGPAFLHDCPAGYVLTGFFGRAAPVGICRIAGKCTRLIHYD